MIMIPSLYSKMSVCRNRGALAAVLTVCLLLVLIGVSVSPASAGQQDTEPEDKSFKRLLLLPYPFFNDTIGTGLGVAAIAEGYLQRQMLTVGSVLASAEGTYLAFLMVRNCQVPWLKRLILDPQISSGKFQDIDSFTRSSAAFSNQRPGSNESDKDNFIRADGTDFWVEFKMKYLLPVGSGKDAVFPELTVEDGVFVSGDTGGTVWNPFKSGRTYIELTPFTRNQDLDDEKDTVQETNGIDVALSYDNTDFRLNPSNGSYQRVFYARDWGAFGSSAPWTVMGAEAAGYVSLGPSKNARQRVIALNFWTVDCLTWNSFDVEANETVFHQPPTYKGANLGGLWRMRGYPATRFHDRAAIYYGLEYRHTFRFNPLKHITLNGRLDVDWFQVCGFGELGRVAPSWTLSTLHEDMKWSAGGGIRTMVNNIVIRADLGASSEDAILQLFIGHPF